LDILQELCATSWNGDMKQLSEFQPGVIAKMEAISKELNTTEQQPEKQR